MDISPGNLYYHFKSKHAIIDELLLSFGSDFFAFLNADIGDADIAKEMWIKLTISFQLMGKYRFIFRDASYITHKYPELTKKFTKVMLTTHQAMKSFCIRLEREKIISIDSVELESLNNNLHLLYTQWASYVDVWQPLDLNKKANNDTDPLRINQGVNQMLSMLYPYMNEETKMTLLAIQQQVKLSA